MSVFGRNQQGRGSSTSVRFDTWILKQRVKLSLRFSNKVKIMVNDKNSFSVAAIQEWATQNGFSFTMTDGDQDVFISGHHGYSGVHLHRHCSILHFSKVA